MKPKDILIGVDARKKLLIGIEKLNNVVKATMGPKGRNALLEQQWGGPTMTNDGVTIAREVFLKDKFENMGAQLIKEASRQTNDSAGDGTTTATVLAHAIIAEGMDYIEENKVNPVQLRKGIDQAVEIVVGELENMKKEVKTRNEVAQVATISSQSEEVGNLIADIFEDIGAEGVIQVEDGQTTGLHVEKVEGMQFDKGYLSPYMITDQQKSQAVLENVRVLIVDGNVETINQILPVIEDLASANEKQLLIIASDIKSDALSTLVVNKMRGAFMGVAVRSPEFGARKKAILEDMAILTGAKVISAESGDKLENVSMEDLGRAKKIIVTKDTTTIVEGGGDKKKIKERIESIKNEMESKKSDFSKEAMQERYGKLSGGITILQVGALTDVELKEKKHRIEDALNATRAAIEEGIVIGGGVALFSASLAIDDRLDGDEGVGMEIVKSALAYPVGQIADNAGYPHASVVTALLGKQKNEGFNADTGQYVDMFEAGIVDPKKVVRCALENAASVAGMFLTMESVMVELPDEKKDDINN